MESVQLLVTQSCPTLSNPLDCSLRGFSVHGIFQARMGCHSLLQEIFLTQGSNPSLLHCRQIAYHRVSREAPRGIFLFSHQVVSNSLWPYGLQHTRIPCPSLSPELYSNSCPLVQWCHPTISSSVAPFSSCLYQHQGLFQWVGSLHQVARVLELQLRHQSFQWIFRTDFL